MALHFDAAELAARRAAAARAMTDRGLDGLLCFRQESHYWLTGYDGFGYVYFQCLYLGADGRLTLLARSPDLRQARHTSVIKDIRVWEDRDDVDPAAELKAILREHGLAGRRLGVEWDSYGLTARNGRRLTAALDGVCTLADASDLVSRLRLVKSPAELACIRRAAEQADAALDAALETVAPGAWEGDVLAAMQGAVFRRGGDYSGNPFIIGSGPDALLCRDHSGRRHLDAADQITLEWAGVEHRYHAAMMRTLPVGRATDRHRAMHAAAVEAMEACEAALRPGAPLGGVFDAYARICDAHGLRPHRLNATGYSMGAVYQPNWMDWPMLYHGNPVEAEPGMTFFLHIILMDSDTGTAMCPGHTVAVTDTGCQRLSRHPLDLMVV